MAHPHGDAFSRDASRRKCKRSSQKADKTRSGASQPFMFHYAFLVGWEPSWRVLTVTIRCTSITN